MRFIRDLLGKKRGDGGSYDSAPAQTDEPPYRDPFETIGQTAAPAPAPSKEPSADLRSVLERTERTKKPLAQKADAPAAPAADKPTEAVNIWDMDDDDASDALPDPAPSGRGSRPVAEPAVASAAAARSPARSRRTKTRLIGFEKSDGDVVDLFNDAPKAKPERAVKFPVGWIVVTEGPGRGESFSLLAGMSQIGRGEDQAVQLDFGDNSISRSNHAAIVYDPDTKEFYLGHGGKSNIVRLNDKPLISNESLKPGDVIRIGETVLRFMPLCGKSFNWSDGATGENEDVAIA